MPYPTIKFRPHAINRLFQRKISQQEIRHVLSTGVIIENYPADKPLAKYLLLGLIGKRPIHIVAADNHALALTIIFTAYEPDPFEWSKDFTRRI